MNYEILLTSARAVRWLTAVTRWLKIGLLLAVAFVNAQGLSLVATFSQSAIAIFMPEEEREPFDQTSETEELGFYRSGSKQLRAQNQQKTSFRILKGIRRECKQLLAPSIFQSYACRQMRMLC